eukprot:5155682-Alexandrium_andersonii.AAC.1
MSLALASLARHLAHGTRAQPSAPLRNYRLLNYKLSRRLQAAGLPLAPRHSFRPHQFRKAAGDQLAYRMA